MATMETRMPPVAKKVEHMMEMFGDARVDNYYWLRDDSRTDSEVLSYLREENAYTDFFMAGDFSIPLTRILCVCFLGNLRCRRTKKMPRKSLFSVFSGFDYLGVNIMWERFVCKCVDLLGCWDMFWDSTFCFCKLKLHTLGCFLDFQQKNESYTRILIQVTISVAE